MKTMNMAASQAFAASPFSGSLAKVPAATCYGPQPLG